MSLRYKKPVGIIYIKNIKKRYIINQIVCLIAKTIVCESITIDFEQL